MAVLRHRDFRNLFIGQSASMIGDAIVFVALALYVTQIGTPTAHVRPAQSASLVQTLLDCLLHLPANVGGGQVVL